MKTFNSENPNYSRLFLNKLLWNAVSLVIILFVLVISFESVKPNYFFLTVFFAMILIPELTSKRIPTVSFDTEKKLIIFKYRYTFGRTKELSFHFNETKVEIKEYWYARRKNIFKPYKVLFYTKNDLMEVETHKDGFSQDQMIALSETVQELSSPVIPGVSNNTIVVL